MSVAPSDIADVGASTYHWVLGAQARNTASCNPTCHYGGMLLSRGDETGLTVTGRHAAAETARAQCGTHNSADDSTSRRVPLPRRARLAVLRLRKRAASR